MVSAAATARNGAGFPAVNLFDPHQIPGYTEACEKEQANRDLAFLDLPIPLCGIVARQFCLKHLVLLGNCGNGFLTNKGQPQPEDIAQFLWIVSAEYSLDAKKRTKFVRKLGGLKFLQAIADIEEYLARAFQDSPQGGSGGKQYTADCAWLVEIMAHEYGWDDETIMQKPIARLFQYLRLINKRYNPKALLFNRSESIVTNHLRMGMKPKEGN